MSAKTRITYIAPGKASFVMQDIEWLSKEFQVKSYFFKINNKFLVPFEMLKLLLYLLFGKSKIYLVSFGGYHSYVAALVAKWKNARCYIILNGTDSTSIPEFDYGHLRKGILRSICKWSYEIATALLPVSSSLIATENSYAFDPPRKFGLRNEFPDLDTRIQVVPNGFDIGFWSPGEEKRDYKSFITVVGSANRIVHKGLDMILKVAPYFPDYTFYVVGLNDVPGASSNVKFLGYMQKEQLREAYRKSKFYLQLSLWEGFGCALCEAMLCGCIPIVSNVNVLPEIIGDSGYILMKRSEEELKRLLKEELGKVDSPKTHEVIASKYPMSIRLHELHMLINQ